MSAREAVMKLVRWARMMHLEAGIGLAALGVVGYLAACSDDHRGITEPPLVPGPSFEVVVSEPVRLAFGGSAPSATAASAALQQGDSVTWVSLPAGTVPGGRSATIRNLANGFSATAEVEDGGFDPVPLLASVGDSIEVQVSDGGDGTTRVALVVPPRRPPVIVRTVPPKGGTDVPLNSLIRVVFSEPMDQATITMATVRLLRDTAAVAGAVGLSPDGLRADFVPDSLLARATRYTLVVEAGVADLSGEVLGQSAAVEFTTGNQAAASPAASLTITPGSFTSIMFIGDSLVQRYAGEEVLVATPRDSNGNELSCAAVSDSSGAGNSSGLTWSSSNPAVARVTPTSYWVNCGPGGYITPQGPGSATITATLGEARGTAVVTVLRAMVTPQTATLRSPGETARFEVDLRDAAGRAQPGHALEWSQDNGPYAIRTVSPTAVVFTAPDWGAFTVQAAYPNGRGGYKGYASVRVTVQSARTVATIRLSPDTVRTVPGAGGILLRATVLDANGDTVPGAVTWCGGYPGGCNGFSIWGHPEFYGLQWNEAVIDMDRTVGTFSAIASAGGVSDTIAVITERISVTDVSFQCALASNAEVYCRGYNGYGGAPLGYGVLSNVNGPGWSGPMGPVAVTGGLQFATVRSGSDHRCALTTSGEAYCWGLDEWWGSSTARLLGTAADLEDCDFFTGVLRCSSRPVPVAGGLSFVELGIRDSHTCALTAGGQAWCWGANNGGQLGDGTTTDRPLPVAVTGSLVFNRLSVGVMGTCALTAAGQAYCWGWNGRATVPTLVAGGLSFVAIAGNCGLTQTAAAYCFERDSTGLAAVPRAPGLVFASLMDGGEYQCGLTTTGELWCWGYYDPNWDDDIDGTILPPARSGTSTFRSLSSDGRTPCGITAGGWVECWAFPNAPRIGW